MHMILLTLCLFFSSVSQYYVSARHMALAKAFPESYAYEPQDLTSVSIQSSFIR